MNRSASLRIVSTIPSATEIIFDLGLGKNLLGVSHECNFPAAAASKPIVTSTNFDYNMATSGEIDTHVSESLHEHRSLFALNEPPGEALAPHTPDYSTALRSVRDNT